MDEKMQLMTTWAQEQLLPILGAIAILVIGWIVAVVVAGIVQALLNRTSLDEKLGKALAGKDKPPVALDRWITGLVKWGILLYAFVLFVDALGLDAASSPLRALLDKVGGYLPQVGGAALIALVGWVVAVLVRNVVTKALSMSGLDDRLKKATGDDDTDLAVSKSVGNAAFWIVVLLFLLLVLDALDMRGLLDPLQDMVAKAMGFVPNLLAAAVIVLVGWFVATLVKRIVVSLLNASGLEGLLTKAGLEKVGKGTISGLLGTVAFLLVLLPVISAALGALQLDAVSKPVSGMLDTFFAAIPLLLYATVSIAVAVFVGRLLARFIADLLERLGFDNIFRVLGLTNRTPEEMEETKRPSHVVGTLVFLTIVVLAITTALDLLGWVKVAGFVDGFVTRAAGWLLGIFLFGLGLWLSKLVADLIRDRDTTQSSLLATVARVAILVVAGIAALNEMGLDADVVKWSVILAVGGSALGLALAFGLGGQSHAADAIDRWRSNDKPE